MECKGTVHALYASCNVHGTTRHYKALQASKLHLDANMRMRTSSNLPSLGATHSYYTYTKHRKIPKNGGLTGDDDDDGTRSIHFLPQ
jgi:hypothetical protein